LQKHISKKGLANELKSSGGRGPPARPPPPKPSDNAASVSSTAILQSAPTSAQPQPGVDSTAVKAPPRQMTAPVGPPTPVAKAPTPGSPGPKGMPPGNGSFFKLPPIQAKQPGVPGQPPQQRQPPQQPPPQPSTPPVKQSPQQAPAHPSTQPPRQPSNQTIKQVPPKQPPAQAKTPAPAPPPLAHAGSQFELARPGRSNSKTNVNRTVLNTLRSQAAYIPSTLIDLLDSEDVSQGKSEQDFFLDGQKVKVQDPVSQPNESSDLTPKVFKGAIQIWKPIFVIQIPFKVSLLLVYLFQSNS